MLEVEELFNETSVNKSIQIRFYESENQTNNSGITIIFVGILLVFIIVVLLVVHRVMKVKEATDILKRKKSAQFIGAIYKRNSVSSKGSTYIPSPPTSPQPVMGFDNPTYASSPNKNRRKEAIFDAAFKCELVDMDEIDLDDIEGEDAVDIVMADMDEAEIKDEMLGHRRSVSWS